MSPFVGFVGWAPASEGCERSGKLAADCRPIARRGAPWRAGPKPARGFVFCVLGERIRGGGKVENLLLVFHFSIRPRRRRCGNVGISPAVGEISKGLVVRGESLPLAFHAFHSPGISTALGPHRVFRQRANKVNFACCIRRAASVSLRISACRFSNPAVIPSFKYPVHLSKEVSFSYGVR